MNIPHPRIRKKGEMTTLRHDFSLEGLEGTWMLVLER